MAVKRYMLSAWLSSDYSHRFSLILFLLIFKAPVSNSREPESDDSLSKALDKSSAGKVHEPVSAEVDVLQKPVDVRRLVPSRGTGPPKHRQHPGKASRQPKMRKVFLSVEH